jgi:hypothetical protein
MLVRFLDKPIDNFILKKENRSDKGDQKSADEQGNIKKYFPDDSQV